MSIIKTRDEINHIRRACDIASIVLNGVVARVSPGITTRQLDDLAAQLMHSNGVISAFLGYKGYPCHTCLSVNHEVVHGLATERSLSFGDIISVDVGIICDGFVGDLARTVPVGGCSVEGQRLMDVTEQSLYSGISRAVSGNRVSDISRGVQEVVERQGFNVVRDFVGHGVGRSVHEDPQIPNFVDGKSSPRLREGMTIAIEPMVTAGRFDVRVLEDGWTVVTDDGSLSAHFEHTVLVTSGTPEILTWHVKP